jgi:hypothetical protein
MQFNRYIALPKSSLFNQRLFFLFRLILIVAITFYLWQNFVANQKILMELSLVNVNWQPFERTLLLMTFILLPVNWLLEGLKWQVIAADANLSLKQAMKGVVLGLTLDNVLPMGTGAISGRVITLSRQWRARVIPGILVGQVIQSLITFIFGLYGFWLVWSKASSLFHWQPVYSFLLIGISIVVMLAAVFWQAKIIKFLKPLWQYSLRAWAVIFTFSLIRYLVFLIQFMLLATIFAPEIDSVLIFACATWLFAARTFMPKISNLERLGIRALAVVFFMNLFGQPVSGVLMAVIVLWFINLAIPSIIGLTFFKDLKAGSLLN